MKTWELAVIRWQAENTERALSTMKREQYLLTWAGRVLSGMEVGAIRAVTLHELRGDAIRAGWKNRSVNYLVGAVCTVLRAA